MPSRKTCLLAFVLLLSCTFSNAFGMDMNALDLKSAPDEIRGIVPVLKQLEPMIQDFVFEWKYKTPKDEVIKKMEAAYTAAAGASASHPDDLELALLKGLLAYYCYQLDLQDYYQRAIDAFTRARAIEPADIRSQWFLGVHLAKALLVTDGMQLLLEVAGRRPYRDYPVSFWEDYAYCAYLAMMPSHAVMALDRANELQGGRSGMEDKLGKTLRAIFVDPPRDDALLMSWIWSLDMGDGYAVHLNRAFGLSVKHTFSWRSIPGDANNGTVGFTLNGLSYRGLVGAVYPNIFIIAHVPNPGETIAAFAESNCHPRLEYHQTSPDLRFKYPALILEGRNKETYADEDGAHTLLICFSRPEPEHPGLQLESPRDLPDMDGMHFFTPASVFTRYHGEIFYSILFDCADSVFSAARKDFEAFLADLVVE